MTATTAAGLPRLDIERTLCRRSFIDFVHVVRPWFIIEEVHCQIADELEAVERGEIDRLMVFLPPRGSKSETISKLFPAWWIGLHPSDKVMQVSYKETLATDFGREVRDMLADPAYQAIFPGVGLRQDVKAAGKWMVAHQIKGEQQGEYYASGITGGIAGRGWNLGLVDDPLALHVDTPIPTPDGFVRIEDLVVGDYVYGPDGKPIRVTGKSDVVHDRRLYQLTTSDGESILCDGGHLWPYMSDTNLSKATVKTATARTLVEWTKASRPCLPRHTAVEYPERDLPIDPWVLGAWLGDGTSSLGRLTCHPDDRTYLKAEFQQAGYKTTDLADPYAFGVLGLRAELIRAGILNNKHVPEIYLIGSVGQRMALLQGLMDTDGCVSKEGQCIFSNTRKNLVEAVVRLLHSLGLKANMHSKLDTRNRWGSTRREYVVTFRLRDAARMPRKAERTFTPTDKRARSFEIEPTDLAGSVQCITVEREDGLFLCGDGYIVTHNSEQDAVSDLAREHARGWYGPGFYSRRQPGRNAIVLISTRWAADDLPGHLIDLQESDPHADRWRVVEIPALLSDAAAERLNRYSDVAEFYDRLRRRSGVKTTFWVPDAPVVYKAGDSYAPRRWPLKELQRTRGQLTERSWSALYQQRPTAEAGHIMKRDCWQKWPKKEPPECYEIIACYDTAFDEEEEADYSARTTWGLFEHMGLTCAIMVEAWRDRVDAADLLEEMERHTKEYDLDRILVEKRASGSWVIKEARKRGLPARPWLPPMRGSRNKGKVPRAHAASFVLESGAVWYCDRRWAETVINEAAEVPFGTNDDLADTVTMALIELRERWKVELRGVDDQDEDDDEEFEPVMERRRVYG